MGFEPLYLVRGILVIVPFAWALWISRRAGGLAARAAMAVGWSGVLLALLAPAGDPVFGTYLIAAALGFGLVGRRQPG